VQGEHSLWSFEADSFRVANEKDQETMSAVIRAELARCLAWFAPAFSCWEWNGTDLQSKQGCRIGPKLSRLEKEHRNSV